MLQWGVTAFEKEIEKDGVRYNEGSVQITLYADTEEQALSFAEEIIKRPHYRVHSVVDYEAYTKTDEKEAIMKEYLKTMKKMV